MPELPEVETTVRLLRQLILNLPIQQITVLEKGIKLLGGRNPDQFSSELLGQQFQTIERKGKFISISTSNPKYPLLMVHLRMTGRFLFQSEKAENITLPPSQELKTNPKSLLLADSGEIYPDPYTRIIFKFEKSNLYFSDLRRFATVHLLDYDSSRSYKGLQTLGVDAISENFTKTDFFKLLQKNKNSTRNIYQFLLDQTKIAGVGNIYANEALFIAKISPLRPLNSITKSESYKLYSAIRLVLEEAVAAQGTSLSDYKTPLGTDGQYQQQLRVYGQKETVVKGKKYSITRQKVGGRSIWFVPELQR